MGYERALCGSQTCNIRLPEREVEMKRKEDGERDGERGGEEVGSIVCLDNSFASHDHDSQLASLMIR